MIQDGISTSVHGGFMHTAELIDGDYVDLSKISIGKMDQLITKAKSLNFSFTTVDGGGRYLVYIDDMTLMATSDSSVVFREIDVDVFEFLIRSMYRGDDGIVMYSDNFGFSFKDIDCDTLDGSDSDDIGIMYKAGLFFRKLFNLK